MSSTVSADFNAYHKWLGILPAEQPAHHYRLLGIALFEGDAEVIAAAADRQMGHIKSFAAGRYAAESQALLNELARARVTLLNARQKAAYDRGLQQRLANDVQAPPRPPQKRPAESPVKAAPEAFVDVPRRDFVDRPVQIRTRYNRRRRTAPFVPMLAIAVGIAAIAAALYYAALMRPSGAEQVSNKPVTAVPPVNDRFDFANRVQPDLRRPRHAEDLRPEREVEPQRDVPELKQNPQRPLPLLQPPLPEIAHVIDLDLESRRQRYALKDMTHTQLRVSAIRDCELPYVIRPTDGYLDKTSKVAITISGIRDVVIEVNVVATKDNASILVECHVTNDEGRDIPLTLSNMDRVCRNITNQGHDEAAALDKMEAEKSRLLAWIEVPILKPLAERGKAKALVMELGILIPEQSALVESLRAELDVAEGVRALAAHIHDDCALEIAGAE